MIDVLVLGQPYAASRIARALDSRAADLRATFVPQTSYVKLLATPPRSKRVVLMRAGYRVGAATARGRIFDAYWALLRRSLPEAAVCHYWLGTDVLNTVREARAGTLRWEALAAARDDLHLADAPWLASELESVNLQARTAYVPRPYHAPPEASPLRAEFRVLTYLPAPRFDFYGGEPIMEVARRLPDVPFDVVGRRNDPPRREPANVEWHGWVSDMEKFYAKATVVVRVPRHDGFGATVIEGLLSARHVVYIHDVPFVRTISPVTPEDLLAVLAELRDSHLTGRLGANLAGRAYALEEFDEAKLAANVTALVKERA
jgi:Glycosyl transferases group 1